MFYSECFGSKGPRGLAGGKKTCSPEKLPFSSPFPFSFYPAKNPSSCFQELLECISELVRAMLCVRSFCDTLSWGSWAFHPVQTPLQPTPFPPLPMS